MLSARQFLDTLRKQELELARIEETLMVLRTRAEKVTATWKPDMTSGGGTQDKVGEAVVKMIEAEQHFIDRWNQLLDDRRKVENILMTWPDPQLSCIIWLYYVCGKTWEQVAVSLHVSLRTIHRRHPVALDLFEQSWH